jgi:hypothetical protein
MRPADSKHDRIDHRFGVIMPVRCDAIGHGEVLAWPALRQTSKGNTIPRQSENAQSEPTQHCPSDVPSDRSWAS